MPPHADERYVGHYQLLERIGSGGMSAVYKAIDIRTSQIVAVKIASRVVADDPQLSKRFEQEFALVQRLSHDHLVKVLDYGQHEGVPFLVMEYVDGISLARQIANQHRLTEEETLAMVRPVASALSYLHAQQILHRDIKPANILMAHDGRVKLADLGLIKDLDAQTQLTRTHTALGTLQYASPEQCLDAGSSDPRSDIYALAVTIYAALTGENPFGKGAMARIIQRKLANHFDAPIVKRPDLRPEIDAAIRLAMNADLARRPATIEEFVAFLTGARKIESPNLPGSTLVPKDAAAASAGMNRRIKARYATEVPGKCQAALRSVDQSWPCTITDMSVAGLCLEGDRRFEPGSTVKITFLAADATTHSYIAWVRWCKPADGKSWQHGCQFIHALDDEDLEPLLTGLMDRTQMG